MTAPELADSAPGGGRVAGTVDAMEHSCNGAASQLVLVAVHLDEVADVGAYCLLFVARFLLILHQIVSRQIKQVSTLLYVRSKLKCMKCMKTVGKTDRWTPQDQCFMLWLA